MAVNGVIYKKRKAKSGVQVMHGRKMTHLLQSTTTPVNHHFTNICLIHDLFLSRHLKQHITALEMQMTTSDPERPLRVTDNFLSDPLKLQVVNGSALDHRTQWISGGHRPINPEDRMNIT